MTRRWFPVVLALTMSLVHVGFIAYDYWEAERNEKSFHAVEFIRRDLERPRFDQTEPSFSCSHLSYTASQSVDSGLNLPAYIGAQLLYTLLSGNAGCDIDLMTPRGQIVTSVFVPPLWLMLGLSVQRLAQRRWRSALTGRVSRAVVWSALLPLVPLGSLLLLLGLMGLVLFQFEMAGRPFGMGLWMLYVAALAAERLGIGPFRSATGS